MDRLRGKRVVITGGSSGIGLATARMLRSAGAHLVLVARDPARLDAAVAQLHGISGSEAEVRAVALDVGDRDAVAAAGPQLLGSGPVDVLINNAGVVMPGEFLDLDPHHFDEMMRINYHGAVHLTRLLLPPMVQRGSGHVAFVSSLAGLVGIYGYTAYAPSKAALKAFAEALRCELKPHGVGVTVCYPPDTDTPQLAFEDAHKPAGTRAIAGNAGALSAEQVARALLSGIASDRFQVIPGAWARLAELAYRLFPGVARAFFDRDVRAARQRGS